MFNQKKQVMKKIFTLFVALLATVTIANAQILSEGFEVESEADLTGWTILDEDGDGISWMSIYDNSQIRVHSGLGVIVSLSFLNNYGPLTPDNWLISPQVNLTGASYLSFWACGQDNNYSAENLSVYVSTTGMNPSDFTQVLNITTDSIMSQYVVDLAAYAGQAVYVAFRHHDITDMFMVNVDDVEILAGSAPTAIEELAAQVNVYPNPSSDVVFVNTDAQISTIDVINVAGQKLSSLNVNNNNAQINVNGFAAGIYFLQINTENGLITKKINVR